MKKIRAIYLPDMASDKNEIPIYEYDTERKGFYNLKNSKSNEELNILENILYDKNWLVFETELVIKAGGITSGREYGNIISITEDKYDDYFKGDYDIEAIKFLKGEESQYDEE